MEMRQKNEEEEEDNSLLFIIQALYSFNRISKYFLHRLVYIPSSICDVRIILRGSAMKTNFRKIIREFFAEIFFFSLLCP